MKLTIHTLIFLASIVAVVYLAFATAAPRWSIIGTMLAVFVAAVAVVVTFIDKYGDKSPDMPGYDD